MSKNEEIIPGRVIIPNSSAETQAWRDAIRAEVERSIVPNAKTKEEFRTYLTEALGMIEVPMTEQDWLNHSEWFIDKLCPELLTTPRIPFPTDHTPTREELDAIFAASNKRFREARSIPLERTGLVFTKYYLERYVDDHKLSDVEVLLEEISYTYTVSGQSYYRNDAEDQLSRHFFDDIRIFRGVTEEDIHTKSEWYNTYVTYLTGQAIEEARNL